MRRSYLIAVLLMLGVLTACTRENEVIEPFVPEMPGIGGSAKVNVIPTRMNRDIDSCTIYVGYGDTVSQPMLTLYDDLTNVVMVNGRPTGSFDSLSKGNYYFYGVGYDNVKKEQLVGGARFRVVDSTKGAEYTFALELFPLP